MCSFGPSCNPGRDVSANKCGQAVIEEFCNQYSGLISNCEVGLFIRKNEPIHDVHDATGR